MFIDTVSRKLLEKEEVFEQVRKHGEAKCVIELEEEPGEILITLLMSLSDICKGVNEATKIVFGNDAIASEITLSDYRRKINFKISK